MPDLQLVGLLAFTALVAGVSFGTRPLISYLAVDLGAGPAEIGLIASSFGVLATMAIAFPSPLSGIGLAPLLPAERVLRLRLLRPLVERLS